MSREVDASKLVEYFLEVEIAAFLGTDEVDHAENFMDMGVDSSLLVGLSGKLEEVLGIPLDPTFFFEHKNLEGLAGYILREHRGKVSALLAEDFDAGEKHHGEKEPDPAECTEVSVTSERARGNDSKQAESGDGIAVIGLSGVSPESPNTDHFWRHLCEKSHLIKEIPKDHFDCDAWEDGRFDRADMIYCKWGSFIDDVDKFDAPFFGISTREAESMDPQLRYLLQVMYHCAEDAGCMPGIRGSDTGVYIGSCFHDYADEIGRTARPVEAHDGTGNAPSMLANRPSFYFDLKGPSLSVDTACSSSLVALHLACKALQEGACEMAFAAGCNLILSPRHYSYLCAIEALSKSGHCHTFDGRADGYVPGEGVAAVLLKPLEKAIEAGDKIIGVVKGSAIRHGGYTPSITAPSVDGEMKVLLSAWEDAGIHPDTLGYIEAHGTGTKLGDPVEVNALKKAFARYTSKTEFCGLGSAKAHVGHLEGAAGIAGVIKVLLSMKHGAIPAMPDFEELNPYISLEESPFYINRDVQKWERIGDGEGTLLPLRAGVSSFGFGGAYGHVVLEAWEQGGEASVLSERSDTSSVIVLSARTEERLVEVVKRLLSLLMDGTDPSPGLREIACTLQTGREAMEERLGLVASSKEELIEKLQEYMRAPGGGEGIFRGSVKRSKNGLAIFHADEDIEGAVAAALNEHCYEPILEAWVKGFAFDWNVLYEGSRPQPVELPLYPFEKTSYWARCLSGDSGQRSEEEARADLPNAVMELEQADTERIVEAGEITESGMLVLEPVDCSEKSVADMPPEGVKIILPGKDEGALAGGGRRESLAETRIREIVNQVCDGTLSVEEGEKMLDAFCPLDAGTPRVSRVGER